MGERLLCTQEVVGSIPVTSTIAFRATNAPKEFCSMSDKHLDKRTG